MIRFTYPLSRFRTDVIYRYEQMAVDALLKLRATSTRDLPAGLTRFGLRYRVFKIMGLGPFVSGPFQHKKARKSEEE